MQRLGIIGYFGVITNFIGKTLTIAELEARKLHHDFTELLTRAVQPALWLLIFGEVLARVRAIPTGNLPYIDFMAPGILAQSVLFIAIFYGIAIIWERDLGIVHKFLATPTPRSALVLGKALSGGTRPSSGSYRLRSRSCPRCTLELEHYFAPIGCGGRNSGGRFVLHVLFDHSMLGENTRAIHGNRPNSYHATFLCKQCDLSDLDNAKLAAGRFPS